MKLFLVFNRISHSFALLTREKKCHYNGKLILVNYNFVMRKKGVLSLRKAIFYLVLEICRLVIYAN